MTTWTSPTTLAPAIGLLVRRWHLPAAAVATVAGLLESQGEGATALELTDGARPAATAPAGARCDFGAAALDLRAAPPPASAGPHPLVLLRHADRDYLQSWRYYAAEQTIARELLRRASSVSAFQDLSVSAFTDLNPAQQRAVRCALQHPLTLISGGPGTGKTHTIARFLALVLSAGSTRAVQLAAPTGKAADRMKEAVDAAADHLPDAVPPETRVTLRQIAAGAATLHRVLGFNPATGECRYNATQPLPCDLLIIDECSMVDTLLWQALLVALKPSARLVLVGDPHQLESVSAGDVLGSLVRHAESGGPLAAVWVELTESQRFKHRPGIGALADAIVNLQPDAAIALLQRSQVGRVVPNAPALGSSASSLIPPNVSQPSTLNPQLPPSSAEPAPLASSSLTPSLSSVASGEGGIPHSLNPAGLVYLGDHEIPFAYATLPAEIRAAVEAVAFAATPESGLAALNRIRFLTAHRDHRHGAAGLNAAITRALEGLAAQRSVSALDVGSSLLKVGCSAESTPAARSAAGSLSASQPFSVSAFPPATPILIDRNDPETGLSNGSIGLIMTIAGVRAAYFPADTLGAPPRRIALSQLPDHSPAWAMTIHRSQGSEFDHVVVYLPRDDSPLATRELLYTAITRAKRCVYLSGSESTLRAALTPLATRCTLIGRALMHTELANTCAG